MKRTKPNEIDSETTNILDDIANKCDEFQGYTVLPERSKTTLHTEENLVLCDELLIEVMLIENATILHIVDTATRLSSSTFLDKHDKTYGK